MCACAYIYAHRHMMHACMDTCTQYNCNRMRMAYIENFIIVTELISTISFLMLNTLKNVT